MRQVFDLDSKSARHVTIRTRELERADIGIRSRNGRRQIRIETASVRGVQDQADHETLTLELFPVDVEAALRLEVQHQKIRTISAMDAHATPARHVADDRITGHRLAALRITNHEAVDTLD